MSLETLEFVENNFQKLPKDVAKAILLSIPPSDLLNFCVSNSEFRNICQATNILDIAALEFLKEKTPLSDPITSFTQQANLVKQGFETIYHVSFRKVRDRWVSDEGIKFGMYSRSHNVSERGTRTINFRIRGFPGKSGTIVHIAYVKGLDKMAAFMDDEDALDELLHEGLKETLAIERDELLTFLREKDVIYGEYAIISLPLP